MDAAVPTWQIREITRERSYWGAMTGAEAEFKLRRLKKGGNCYLIRYSKERQHYVISVIGRQSERDPPTVSHFKLDIMQEGDHIMFEIEDTENKFSSISSLLEFYQEHPVSHSVSSIGEACGKQHQQSGH